MAEAKTRGSLRHYRNSLAISSAAVVVFGVWDIIKLLMLWFFGAGQLQEQLDLDTSDFVEMLIFIVLFAIFAAVDIAIRFSICKNAVREARGSQPVKNGWLVLAALLAVSNLYSIISLFATGRGFGDIPSLIVDLTALYALIDLLRSAVLSRRLAGQTEG